MSTTRVMPGLLDLTGRQFGTLKAQRMVSRHPEPKYAVRCEKCDATSEATHSSLVNGAARCRNSSCGKQQRQSGRELLAEQQRKAAEREAARRAEDLEASELRMSAESDGWERPSQYRPAPSEYQPLSERDRIALRERREAEEQERIEAERPRLEAARKANEERKVAEQHEHERSEKQRSYWSEWVLNDRDPKLFVSETMLRASMPLSEADAFNESAVKKFVSDTHEYRDYRTPENADHILSYLSRNGVRIIDVDTLKGAFVRLRDLGILHKKPAPPPVEPPRPMNLTITRPALPTPPGPKVHIGRDYNTGSDREFTQREVDRMSSKEYARAFPTASTIGDWLAALDE